MASSEPSSSVLARRSSSSYDTGFPQQNPSLPSSTPTLSSILTGERLRDHNRRPSNATASPYYRGLTDSALYFRSLGLSPIPSPGHYSVASSGRSASSSVLMAIQEWAPSCFYRRIRNKEELGDGGDLPKAPTSLLEYPQWDPGLLLPPPDVDSRKPLRENGLVPVSMPQAASEAEKESKYVWAYKYRPRFLNEFICNRKRVDELLEVVEKQQCSHFIFEGPAGVGKRTMTLAFLRDVLGPEKLKTKKELRKIELKGEHIGSIEVNMRTSFQHVEVNLSELRGYEKHVIVSLMNESCAPLDKTVQCDPSNFRAIVLHEADKLSTDAQHYIRWIMEKYKGCNKIFFCCYDASKLQIIEHLCKTVKLFPPSDSEIVEVLGFIARKEHIELPHHLAVKIAENSKNNLRQAIRSFEASWKSNPSFKEEQDILTGWEEDIANIAKSIVKEQSPNQLYKIRGKLKKLIEHDVSPEFIFNILILELKELLDEQFQGRIDAMYQEYKMASTNICDSGPILCPKASVASSLDRQVDSGDKYDHRRNIHYFMRIEEFTAKFMSFYKSFITKTVGASACC